MSNVLFYLTTRGSLYDPAEEHYVQRKLDMTAYLWMEHTRSVLSAASRTELVQNCSSFSLEWSRWLH